MLIGDTTCSEQSVLCGIMPFKQEMCRIFPSSTKNVPHNFTTFTKAKVCHSCDIIQCCLVLTSLQCFTVTSSLGFIKSLEHHFFLPPRLESPLTVLVTEVCLHWTNCKLLKGTCQNFIKIQKDYVLLLLQHLFTKSDEILLMQFTENQ